jgi:NitT/TauT family transport system substrate-binding protein
MIRRLIVAVALCGLVSSQARAEVGEIRIAQQFGLGFLPMMILQRDGNVQKHAAAAGIPDLKVDWVKLGGPSAINDGLISGNIHFAALGVSSVVALWDRTRGRLDVKGVAAISQYPFYVVSRNPKVKTLADFSSADRIAVPSVKISMLAILLQMGAAKEFGHQNYARLDPFTVSLSHPDAVVAMSNPLSEINAHVTTSPFYEREMQIPGVHLVTTSFDIMGGPATGVVVAATGQFREANPKIYKAFLAALNEAIETINADKRKAVAFYLAETRDKSDLENTLKIIEDPNFKFTTAPAKVLETAQFMAQAGLVKQAPASIGDLFFPEVAAK